MINKTHLFQQIPDPTVSKPEDWDESEPPQIPDITANKPDGWLDDEEEMIPDRSAKKPGIYKRIHILVKTKNECYRMF